MTSAQQQVVKFAPLSGALDVAFLTELGRRKLHILGLNDEAIDISGSFSRAERQGVSSPICLGADAFAEDSSGVPPSLCVVPGTLRNANTLDEFLHDWDKTKMLEEAGQRIADDIASGAALAEPERLLRFLLLTFADLKTHKYYYWFGFPAFSLSPPPTAEPAVPLSTVLSEPQLQALARGFADLGQSSRSPAFFCVRLASRCTESVGELQPVDGGGLEVAPLSAFPTLREAAARSGDRSEVLLAFCDPCPLANHPGWPMRNLVALASSLIRDTPTVGIIAFREPPPGAAAASRSGAPPSLLIRVSVPSAPSAPAAFLPEPAATAANAGQGRPLPAVVGWEKNSNGKLGPRVMDLSSQMDPVALAESSVDLNLRLMRWRLMPSLQTERVAATRCLLMGAGTLGCSVARCLIGWGVRHITFVDSGVVSFSNPVRQSLFTFEECLDGGSPKAQAAADALKKIWPSVEIGRAHV